MHILYATPSFQHPLTRGPTRHYHFVRELAARHSITLLTLGRSTIAREAVEELRSYTRELRIFDVTGHSAPLAAPRVSAALRLRRGVSEMRAAFRQLLETEQPDVVLYHGKSIFPVIQDLQGVPLVIDFCDATSMRLRTQMAYEGLLKRPVRALQCQLIRRVEQRMLEKTRQIAFISARDGEAVFGASGQFSIIPNGIDREYWTPRGERPRSGRLVFTGVMSYPPNEDAALYLIERILPRLRGHVPGLEIFIVGREPTRKLLRAARPHPEVTVTGFVDDVRPYLESAALFVAPLRYASGMQNKVLEAFAMGVPVIATPVTAAGLRTDETEPPIVTADGADSFANGVRRLLAHPEERGRLGREGRRFVEAHFQWSVAARQLERLCFDAVEASAARCA